MARRMLPLVFSVLNPRFFTLKRLSDALLNQTSTSGFSLLTSNNQIRALSFGTLRTCWKCGSEKTSTTTTTTTTPHYYATDEPLAALFCQNASCRALQPPQDINYFHLFGLPKVYELDTNRLAALYKTFQQRLHPDVSWKFTEREKVYSEELSSRVNKAYETLLNPVSRALYLLQLHNSSLDEDSVHLDRAFLMELMETNEKVAEQSDQDELKVLFDSNRLQIDKLIHQISRAFDEQDIAVAKHLIAQIKYFVNIEEKIKQKTFLH